MSRKNYMKIPSDYKEELKNKGQRLKAMAFTDVYEDHLDNNINSERFYSKAWNVSKTTVHNWLIEFTNEIELFESYWHLKNKQQNSYAQNQGDHYVTTSRPKIHSTYTYITDFQENTRPLGDHHVTKALNIYNNNTKSETSATDGEFEIHFAECRFIVGKYLGSKEEAYKSYLVVKDYLNIKVIVVAYKAYCKDNGNDDKSVGLARFINESLYLSYLPTKIQINADDKVLQGIYKNEVFTDNEGNSYKLTVNKFLQRLKNNEILFSEVA